MIDDNAIVEAMLKIYTDQDNFLGTLEELIARGDGQALLKLIAQRRRDVFVHLELWEAMKKIAT